MDIQKSYKGNKNSGHLYLVPTPIGNLEDITFRAVRILNEVEKIASEDTRTTQKLLNHFDIKTGQVSLHEHNFRERIPQLLEWLEKGNSLAQVSDAGMPSISDPGHELVRACLEKNITVVALPGPTAGLTALIASGLSPQPFYFYGFLPRKESERKQELTALASINGTIIIYESPYRIAATLEKMQPFFEKRKVVLCRELTKVHEEYLRGTLSELLEYAQNNKIKGECCILVEGSSEEIASPINEEWSNLSIKQHVELVMEKQSVTSKEAIKQVAKDRKMKKQEIYKEYHTKE